MCTQSLRLRRGGGAQTKRLVLVDVRTPEEVSVSTLPGALTRADYEREKDAAAYRNAVVVPFCTIGARSGAHRACTQPARGPAPGLQRAYASRAA